MTGQQWTPVTGNAPYKRLDDPMTEPVMFESKYQSKCPICRLRIQAGERVNGIKLDTGKWAVWHTSAICDTAARKRYVGLEAPDVPRSATQPGIDPLLVAFEEEAKGL